MITDEQLDKWGKHIIHKLEATGKEDDRNFLNMLQGVATRLNENKDAVICVGGERGMGKTSLAIISALILRQYGVSFNFSNIFYGQDDIEKSLEKVVTNEHSCFIFDEMIDFAYSREAMTTVNRTIVKILTKARKLNHVYFFCIPRFKSLDSNVRNFIVHYWIEVYWKNDAKAHDEKFAYAALFSKDKNPATSDPWGIEDIAAKKYKPVRGFQDTWKVMKKFRSYICDLTFPALPIVIEKEYEELSKLSLASGVEGALDVFKNKKSAEELKNLRINKNLQKFKDNETEETTENEKIYKEETA